MATLVLGFAVFVQMIPKVGEPFIEGTVDLGRQVGKDKEECANIYSIGKIYRKYLSSPVSCFLKSSWRREPLEGRRGFRMISHLITLISFRISTAFISKYLINKSIKFH